ncbi:hypothetical protein [Clostridium sp.]|uniref:hypothetical protein n=1 Tax=Clostridium sp. TaxID=1506 RepID=UPI003D6D4FB3
MYGSLHFCTHGRDIASMPLEELVAPGGVVDNSDIAEDDYQLMYYDIFPLLYALDAVLIIESVVKKRCCLKAICHVDGTFF